MRKLASAVPKFNFILKYLIVGFVLILLPFDFRHCKNKGVTGEVYQAINLQTHEMMAVKEIRFDHDTFADAEDPPVNGSDSPRQRTVMLRHHRETQSRLNAFRRECDLLSSLSHPAVVRFLGADEQTPKVLRLFTELHTAGTLADVVRDRLPEALVRRYAYDLARAVAYLHDRVSVPSMYVCLCFIRSAINSRFVILI